MCGIAGLFGAGWDDTRLGAMIAAQRHRGPDDVGALTQGIARLGHDRLSIIDLSAAGRNPMISSDGRYAIVLNGEIYNYRELRQELRDYPFRSSTDTEVALAAYAAWGERCLERFVGMFSFLIWDDERRRLFGARDRFGVKPFYYWEPEPGRLAIASEVKALFAAGLPRDPDPAVWASYLAHGSYGAPDETFWRGARSLPAGCSLTFEDGRLRTRAWYDFVASTSEVDVRDESVVAEEYGALLAQTIELRFRADVPVGINLSGGLDSSTLLALVHGLQGPESAVHAYSFVTGHAAYDELPWVEEMLRRTSHPHSAVALIAAEVPGLARDVAAIEDEPYGGLPTLAYAKVFEAARADGVIVLLDGQGMDEQWAGYDYYLPNAKDAIVQGVASSPLRPAALSRELAALAVAPAYPTPYPDRLRNLQYRDTFYTKLPRALRFNDRISMRASTELREPFLDHRLFELAFRQHEERKLGGGQRKRLLRTLVRELMPAAIVDAPKRPLQTPQREWLRGPLRAWATDTIEAGMRRRAGWLDPSVVRREWEAFLGGAVDNSFFVWQWLGLELDA
ncbi:MAG: asparagine synthase (glutamine-hydrolyzing) [Deltaproteobacteria bacterium]|nr:asparagine synthase (glutamine-hydrolyzing) [Deltaproteobacteria bacterium]